MNEERDRFLAEKIGRSYPILTDACNLSEITKCKNCGSYLEFVPDIHFVTFDSWAGLGALVNGLNEKGILEDILIKMYQRWKLNPGPWICFTHMILNPTRFSDLIYEFLRSEGEREK